MAGSTPSARDTQKAARRTAYLKLVVAIILDLADAFIGRLIGFGTVFDLALTVVAFLMFGPKGLLQLWELVEPTDQIDGFVPTLTLLALAELRSLK